jgi:hypothetical protein
MHKKKEEVILRILAQESLDVELWLKRYEFLKFWSYFVDFSEARDVFVNIFQILKPNCKFLDNGLILEKSRGLNAKCLKLEFSGIIFLKETRGPSPRAVIRAGRAVHRGPTAARTEGAGAQRHAHWSMASSRSGAPTLTGRGAKDREEHGDVGLGLTGARAAAWRLGDAVARRGHEKLSEEGFRCGR